MSSTSQIKAAVDTDFLVHVAAIRKTNPSLLLKHYCIDANQELFVHELLYHHEAKSFNEISCFFSENIVQIHSFLSSMRPHQKLMYEKYIKDLYFKYKAAPFPCDVFFEWRKSQSFGELHSITMCILYSFSIMLSDDGDAKTLASIAKQLFKDRNDIRILNRSEAVNAIETKKEMDRKEQKLFAHA